DRRAAPGSGDTASVHGTGVLGLFAVPLLHGSRRSGGHRIPGTQEVPVAVSQHQLSGSAEASASSQFSLDLRGLESRPVRADDSRRNLSVSPGSLTNPTGGSGDCRTVARAARGGDLGRDAFVLRFFGQDGDDRLLVVNLGA